MSDVITIRIPRKTKEKLKKYNINVSETVRKALEDRLNEVEQKDLEARLDRVKRFGEKIDFELLTKLIREDRESH
jgi:predicted DNA-binding protein